MCRRSDNNRDEILNLVCMVNANPFKSALTTDQAANAYAPTGRRAGVFTAGPDERLMELSKTMDNVNRRYRKDMLRVASQLYNPDCPMKPQYLMPRYTTRWEDILEIK